MMAGTSFDRSVEVEARAAKPLQGLVILPLAIAVGGLAIFSMATDSRLYWKDVYGELASTFASLALSQSYTQLASNIHTQIALSPTDPLAIGLLTSMGFGVYSRISHFFEKRIDRLAVSAFFTLGSIGIFSMLFGMAKLLYPIAIIVAVGATSMVLNLGGIRRLARWIAKDASRGASTKLVKPQSQSQSKATAFLSLKSNLLIVVPIAITFACSFYYSAKLPVTDFDALIYHAEIAKILFQDHGFPQVFGPSVGIEISGNYPPLFPAIAAGLYCIFGRFDDILLRILPALFGLILTWATYRIGEKLIPRSGKYSALILICTPLFVFNLLISSTTSLLAASIALSMLGVFEITGFSLKPKPPLQVATRRDERYSLDKRYLMTGAFLGFALLSSYQALFYAIVPIASLFLIGKYYHRKELRRAAKPALVIGLVALAMGTLWYARNTVAVGNPLYPWLSNGQTSQEQQIFAITKQDIQKTGSAVTFGKLDFGFSDVKDLFRFNPMLFPSFSFVVAVGLCALIYRSTKFVPLALWVVVPIVGLIAFGTIFPRYFMPDLPALALSTGCATALLIRNSHFQKASAILVSAILIATYALVGFPAAAANPAVNLGQVTPEKLQFATNAGPTISVLGSFYDGDSKAWNWIAANANSSARVATFDPRIYYMGDYKNIIPLDGRTAAALYALSDPAQIKQFLGDNHIRYVFDSATAKSRLWSSLPMTSLLGSEQFPVYKKFDSATIYIVKS